MQNSHVNIAAPTTLSSLLHIEELAEVATILGTAVVQEPQSEGLGWGERRIKRKRKILHGQIHMKSFNTLGSDSIRSCRFFVIFVCRLVHMHVLMQNFEYANKIVYPWCVRLIMFL